MKHRKDVARQGETLFDPSTSLVTKAARLSDAGDSEEALRVLSRDNGSSAEVRNAQGVCLMRLGRVDDAVRVFRSLVLQPGCTWMKAELRIIYRMNFATALLLAKNPLGLLDTIHEVREQDHPSVMRLRETLHQWEKSLSLWQLLGWRVGIIPAVSITIGFLPGEFVDPLTVTATTLSTTPTLSDPTTHLVV